MAMSVGRKTRNDITSNVTFNEGIGAGMIEIEKISNLEKNCFIQISYCIMWIFSVQCRNCRDYWSTASFKKKILFKHH